MFFPDSRLRPAISTSSIVVNTLTLRQAAISPEADTTIFFIGSMVRRISSAVQWASGGDWRPVLRLERASANSSKIVEGFSPQKQSVCGVD